MKKVDPYVRDIIRDIGYVLLLPTLVLFVQIGRELVWPFAFHLDTVAHFCGGFSIAFAATQVYNALRRRKMIESLSLPMFAYLLLGTVGLAGIFWEFLEFILLNDIFQKIQINLYLDTLSDLSMDLLGGIAWIIAVGFRKKV